MKEIFEFLTSKRFLIHLGLISLFLLLCLVITLFWLRIYTNHGQKLELPDYTNQAFSEASLDAKEKSFEIIANDSVHIVGKKGGLIIEQNPKPNSMVKENRKIYVTITKFQADTKMSEDLPQLYGRDFERKKRDLAFLNLNCRIKDYKYDSGEPNHILEVYYNGQIIDDGEGRKSGVEIEIGSTLDFVLSKRDGQRLEMEDLACKTVSEAIFLLESLNINVGEIKSNEQIEDQSTAFVVSQNPPYSPGATIESGQSVDLIISSNKPANCN